MNKEAYKSCIITLLKGYILSKKVLLLSTKNNSRSIIAEAVLNRYMKQLDIYSAGLKPSVKIDANCVKLLQREGLWNEDLKPKSFNDLDSSDFDLVVILCEKAMDRCPNFSEDTKIIYLDYENLEGKNFSAYEETLKEIKMELIPILRLEL